MKITDIKVVQMNVPARKPATLPRRPSWAAEAEVANPMSRYPKVKPHRNLWTPQWQGAWCQVTAEDGTWGLVRASSNKPELVVVVESPVSEQRMRDMFKAVDGVLRTHKEVGEYNQTI